MDAFWSLSGKKSITDVWLEKNTLVGTDQDSYCEICLIMEICSFCGNVVLYNAFYYVVICVAATLPRCLL